MTPKEIRKVITADVWKKLEPLVGEAKHSAAGSPADLSDRNFLEAVLWIARTGSPWRDLPPPMGHWNHVYGRFRRWKKPGVWKRLWQYGVVVGVDGAGERDDVGGLVVAENVEQARGLRAGARGLR